jgi:hypothetical protein
MAVCGTPPGFGENVFGAGDGPHVGRSSWHSLIVDGVDWLAVFAADDGNELLPAVSDAGIVRVEAVLGAVFPAGLRELYRATDGLYDKPAQLFVIWPLAQVVERNQMAWEVEDADRQEWVGLADGGDGGPFCVPRDGSAGVYAWSPIDGEATWMADTVAAFWVGWCTDDLPPW